MAAPAPALDARRLAELFVEHFNHADVAAVEALLADDAVWTLGGSLPASGTWRGRRSIVDDFLAVGGALFAPGSPQFTITTSTAEGDRCLLELQATGESRDGRTYANRYVLAFVARDGLVVSVHEYMDTEAWRAALC